MLLAEFDRGQVVQAAVRTHGVVVPPPGLDHDACLAPSTCQRRSNSTHWGRPEGGPIGAPERLRVAERIRQTAGPLGGRPWTG